MHRFSHHFSHAYAKLQRNLIFLLLILFFIVGFFTSEYLAKKDLEKILVEKTQCQTALISSPSSQDIVNATERDRIIQQEKQQINTPASLVYFTHSVKQISSIRSEVEIRLMGAKDMKVDAADLSLKYGEGLTIVEIRKGSSFSSYPRALAQMGQLVVSGITQNAMNAPFVTLIVEKKSSQASELLTVDGPNTKVFFRGVSVLDMSMSIDTIKL